MLNRRVVMLAILGSFAMVATACGVTRESAVEDLVDAGYEADTAQCIMTSIEDQGFAADDLADPIDADVETAIGVAVEACITAADLVGLGDNVGEEQMRADVISNLVDGGMEPDQAECIVEGVEAADYTMVDLAQAGLDEQTSGGVIDALQAATLDCTTG